MKNRAYLLVTVCIVLLFMAACSKDSGSDLSGTGSVVEDAVSQIRDTSPEAEETESTALQFPYQLEGGKLKVSSLFQFSGFNPDCGLAEGEDIASLSFSNTSEEYLASAVFTAVLTDGTEFRFEAVDVPAGASVMAFAADNATYDASTACEAITCEAVFETGDPLMEKAVSVSVEETSVTLTNLTDEDLNDLVIHCHTLFDGDYFGGLIYSYPVETVEAGGSITLQAEDCYLGEVAVVRITQGD